MDTVDVSLLVTFLNVAESGSFAGAAAAVGRTPAAVSMQMKRLEQELGPPGLFVRDQRRMVLTQRASGLIPYARDVIASHIALRRAALEPGAERHLRVGAPDEILPLVIPAAANALSTLSLDFSLETVSDNSNALKRRFDHSGIDVLVTAGAIDVSQHAVIAHMPLLWVTCADRRVEDLTLLPIAVFQDGCRTREIALNACKTAGRAHRIVHSGQSLSGLLTAARAGLAVAPVMASSITADLRVVLDHRKVPRLPVVNLVVDRRAIGRAKEAVDIIFDSVSATMRSVSEALH